MCTGGYVQFEAVWFVPNRELVNIGWRHNEEPRDLLAMMIN